MELASQLCNLLTLRPCMYFVTIGLLFLTLSGLYIRPAAKRYGNHVRGIPRLGPDPGFLGNTTRSAFQKDSKTLITEGYRKYRNNAYSLWTTGMDRVIVPHEFLPEFSKLRREQLFLTASVRHAGQYTGMDIAEKGRIAYDAVSVNLTQNIPDLIEPAFQEIKCALLTWVKDLEAENSQGFVKTNLHALVSHLVSRSTALAFMGSDSSMTQEWLQTAVGYARDVGTVQRDLGPYWKLTWPFIAPFLASIWRLKGRYAAAKKILEPKIERRRAIQEGKDQEERDMLQWLINASKGSDASVDMIARRMLFLSFASIDTTSITCTNVLLDLLARPERCDLLREELATVYTQTTVLDYDIIKAMKLTDSFMKESQRMNPMGLVTFNRQLAISLELSDGTFLPAGTYVSVPQWPILRDPQIYDQPDEFDPFRFVKLNEKDQSEKWTFASHNSVWPGWGTGKFSCPGRHWASVQIKLILIAILENFDICFPDDQVDRPENNVRGESVLPDFAQSLMLRPRGFVR